MAQIKITCTRCCGSGHYSFNLIRGTVCFGCNGSGHLIVDAEKHAKAQAKKAAKRAKDELQKARRNKISAQVWIELQSKFGPFDDTPVGHEKLIQTTQRMLGKTPGDIVQEQLNKEFA